MPGAERDRAAGHGGRRKKLAAGSWERLIFEISLAFQMLPWELIERCTSRQLTSLIAFFRIVPTPELRADYRAAMLATVGANPWRGTGQKPFKMKDFLLDFDREEEQPPEVQWMAMKAWGMAMHGKTHGEPAN